MLVADGVVSWSELMTMPEAAVTDLLQLLSVRAQVARSKDGRG